MATPLSHQIAEQVSKASQLYHRVVLVVGLARSGKTTALQELEAEHGWPLVNVNLALSERLLELTARQRTLRVARIVDDIVKGMKGDVIMLDNIEMLFHPDLKQDPLRLLLTAFHVQRRVNVPLSGPEFLQGLNQRFPERDGMYFLSSQVAEYDRKRTSVGALRQLSLFVSDEATAIQWVRQQLHAKPQSFQDLQPQFMRELQAWAKHEETVELKELLDQCFNHYGGSGPVPSQIHSYLSSNFKDLRKLKKDDPQLVEKAQDRWYVPDPSKQADLDQLRDRSLLKEFEEYKTTTQRKLKVFRTEAVRAGFKTAWQDQDYGTIVKVAEKLPSDVLQEDAILLMYFDNALTRMGDGE